MYEKILEYKNTDPDIMNNFGELGVFNHIEKLTVAENFDQSISKVATTILETYFEFEN